MDDDDPVDWKTLYYLCMIFSIITIFFTMLSLAGYIIFVNIYFMYFVIMGIIVIALSLHGMLISKKNMRKEEEDISEEEIQEKREKSKVYQIIKDWKKILILFITLNLFLTGMFLIMGGTLYQSVIIVVTDIGGSLFFSILIWVGIKQLLKMRKIKSG